MLMGLGHLFVCPADTLHPARGVAWPQLLQGLCSEPAETPPTAAPATVTTATTGSAKANSPVQDGGHHAAPFRVQGALHEDLKVIGHQV